MYPAYASTRYALLPSASESLLPASWSADAASSLGMLAWSSPIFVDYLPASTSPDR